MKHGVAIACFFIVFVVNVGENLQQGLWGIGKTSTTATLTTGLKQLKKGFAKNG